MPHRHKKKPSQHKPEPDGGRVDALRQVLGRSERVRGMVAECADDLSSVNAGLQRELDGPQVLPGIEAALAQSEAVEDKVQEAAEQLSQVNQALAEAVREGRALEERLAAATRQGDAARHAALHDPLTGLPNRALFNDRLEHELAHAKRHRRPLVVMFVDLDEFKQINDVHGHDAGDLVLQTIATRLKAASRNDDTVCRHGGDEFLYVLVDVGSSQEALRALAEKIIRGVAAPFTIRVEDGEIPIQIRPSIGIAIFPQHGDNAEALLGQADKAMYRAKRRGSGYAFAGEDEGEDAPD